MKKSLIAILMTVVFLVSILGPLLSVQNVGAVAPDDPNWYMTVNGNLATDYYSLYPFNKSSTILGLSKYAEFIDNFTNVGLEYAGDRDPWAAPAGAGLDSAILPKGVWINGWFIDITYMHNSWGLRNVWAGALFADLVDYGKPWLRVEWTEGSCASDSLENFKAKGLEIDASQPMMDPSDPNTLNPLYTGDLVSSALLQGGRKTNGTAYTDDIQVLYHGPREFVAVLTTYIADYDEVTGTTLPLIKLTFTVIFYKVKKEVIMLKDVKLLQHAKAVLSGLPVTLINNTYCDGALIPDSLVNDTLNIDGGVLVQFSDRQEWDLGKKNVAGTLDYSSYGHYYTDGQASNDSLTEEQYTDYDLKWTILPTLPAHTIVNGIMVNAWGPEPHGMGGGEYDLAQIISNDFKYVGWAAHWPACSDWSIDGLYGHSVADITWYRAMKANDPHYIDHYTGSEPWRSPLVIGEWDFLLSGYHNEQTGPNTGATVISDIQFRGVSVYGVTDLHNGQDKNFIPYNPANGNCIDDEVWYQLDEVFNPWDLQDCTSDKEVEMRWVQHVYGDGVTKAFQLRYNDAWPDGERQKNWPNVSSSDFYFTYWNYYEDWAERVLVNGVLKTPKDMEKSAGLAPINGKDYFLWEDALGFMWVNFTTAPPINATIKILFSTCEKGNSYGWITVGRDSAPVDSVGAAMIGYATSGNPFEDFKGTLQLSGFDIEHPAVPVVPSVLSVMNGSLLPDKTAYRDDCQCYNTGRIAFKDDWCSHWNIDEEWKNGIPISSSNLINIGGPLANMATEYFNDFSTAFYTIAEWTPIAANRYAVMPLTCWSLNRNDSDPGAFHAYRPEFDAYGLETVGYGVISTYYDLNGTVGLNIWGVSGQDTYFTCWSILHSPVLQLALANIVEGVTSIILQFNYTLHPTDYCFVTIVEALGTISELNIAPLFAGMVSEGLRDSETVHYFVGCLPEGWFKEPGNWTKSCVVEDWIGFPVGEDGTQWTEKYPQIHPDP
jgi:hypothetical protein